MDVLITGLAQGEDPAGGVGVASALRDGYDGLRIVGQDYTVRAAGLHHPVFDEVIIHRPWGEFDTEALKEQFGSFLESGGWVISTLDLEGYWLARHFANRKGVLSPPAGVFAAIAKPPGHVPCLTDLGQPPVVSAGAPATALHAFLRGQGWSAWLKGPFHDAFRVRSWEGFEAVVAQLRRYWPFAGGHLQAHVDGTQEAIAFAAHRGRLLDVVWIVKNDLTESGKTIAGSRRDISSTDRAALAEYVAALEWTGGGELELIRDGSGKPWLIEINPRFPAWIAGATLLGTNLPAELLETASGHPHRRGPAHSGFVRVQREIPTCLGFDLLPPLVLYPDEPRDGSKSAFNIHEIAHHIDVTLGLPVAAPGDRAAVTRGVLPELGRLADASGAETPVVHFLPDQLRDRIANTCQLIDPTRSGGPAVELAYSVKTNPDPAVLSIVRDAGFSAEVISLAELHHVRECGFASDRVVVNGPGKAADLAAIFSLCTGPVFADLIEEVEAWLAHDLQRPLGFRLRPAGLRSRFGIALDQPGLVDRLLDLLSATRSDRCLAIYFHFPHAIAGAKVWRSLAETVVDHARMLEDASDRRVVWLDVGGGFYPDDLARELAWLCSTFRDYAATVLPGLQRIYVEPGRALVQDAVAIETSILEVRNGPGRREIVVDASLGDLPEATHYPHRICLLRCGGWQPLPAAGQDRILGRTCMEDDILVQSIDLSGVRKR